MADPFLHHRERYSLSLSLSLLPFFVTHRLHQSPPSTLCFNIATYSFLPFLYESPGPRDTRTCVRAIYGYVRGAETGLCESPVDIVGRGALFTIKLVRCKSARARATNETHCAAGDLPERSSKKAGNGRMFSLPSRCRDSSHRGRKEEGALLPVETPRACFARILLDSAVVLRPEGPRSFVSPTRPGIFSFRLVIISRKVERLSLPLLSPPPLTHSFVLPLFVNRPRAAG